MVTMRSGKPSDLPLSDRCSRIDKRRRKRKVQERKISRGRVEQESKARKLRRSLAYCKALAWKCKVLNESSLFLLNVESSKEEHIYQTKKTFIMPWQLSFWASPNAILSLFSTSYSQSPAASLSLKYFSALPHLLQPATHLVFLPFY